MPIANVGKITFNREQALSLLNDLCMAYQLKTYGTKRPLCGGRGIHVQRGHIDSKIPVFGGQGLREK